MRTPTKDRCRLPPPPAGRAIGRPGPWASRCSRRPGALPPCSGWPRGWRARLQARGPPWPPRGSAGGGRGRPGGSPRLAAAASDPADVQQDGGTGPNLALARDLLGVPHQPDARAALRPKVIRSQPQRPLVKVPGLHPGVGQPQRERRGRHAGPGPDLGDGAPRTRGLPRGNESQ